MVGVQHVGDGGGSSSIDINSSSTTTTEWLGSTAQRNGFVSNMSPIIPSSNNTRSGIAVVGATAQFYLQRQLCDTGYVGTNKLAHVVVPTIAFAVDNNDTATTPSVYVMVDRCLNVKGLSLFGLSHDVWFVT
jgi:hypothetical protein